MAAPKEKCLPSYEYIFNPNILKGKVAFITGGGSGIGFAIAEMFMRHGCQMVIASRNFERVKTAAETLEAATGQKCLPLQMDVRKPQDVLNAVDQALSTFNRLDILVNNAAGNFIAPVTGLSFNAYKTVLEIDTVGTFNCSKVVYEKYLRDHGGVIINITFADAMGAPLSSHAGSAKAAIDALTKHFAVEWGPSNVRVVGVGPGFISGTEGADRMGGPKERHQQLLLNTPLQRAGTRSEIAHVVLFTVSPAGSLITGETIIADGGARLGKGTSMASSMAMLEQINREGGGRRAQSKM